MLTFTDEYTRKSWVYFTKSRKVLRAIFQIFRARVEAETGLKIKVVRCDNAPEYRSLGQAMEPTGLVFEYTTTYTPEQNGVAERLNRSLISVARAMLHDANLPIEFWPEAANTACYLRNRTPIGPGEITPEEAYSGKRPYVGHLKAFGCIAYANIPKERRDKLESTALRTVFIGYMPTTRQYRLYDPVNRRIIVSTAPKFREDARLVWEWNPEPGVESIPFDPMEPVASGATGQLRPERPTENSGSEEPESDTIIVDTGNREYPESDDDDYDPEDPEVRGVRDPEITIQDSEIQGVQGQAIDQVAEQPEGTGQAIGTGRSLRSGRQRTRSPENSSQDPRNLSQEPGDQAPRRLQRELRALGLQAEVQGNQAIKIPKTYAEAVSDPVNKAHWEEAIRTEYAKLQTLGTWEYTDLPRGKKAVGSKLVFAVKYTPTGLIDRYKARLVAQGFSQVLGDDYLETFSPTVRAESLRTLLAIGAHEDLEIRHIDVVKAYPRAQLHATVYMRPPPALNCPKGKVLKLNKPLDGLKQSGREWYIKACRGLKTLGFSTCYSDPSVLINSDRTIIIRLYVDDMLILGKDLQVVQGLISEISALWEIKDLGDVSLILGLNVYRDRPNRSLRIVQSLYIQGAIERFRLEEAKPVTLPVSDRNSLVSGLPNKPQADQALYQSAIGALMWVARGTRPDILYAVGQLSQHCNEPTIRHWNSVLRVFRYLKGTINYSVEYKGTGNSRLQGYCDADYAGDIRDRHSVSGHLYMLNGGPITWTSTKQRCVSTSTTESEYIALSEASKQGQWLRALLRELQRSQYLGDSLETPIFSDNQGCIALAKDPVAHSRTKHIDVRYHYIRELVAFGKTSVEYCPTEDMLADILTKPLPNTAYRRCIQGLLAL
jgi:hypothetical protein